MVSASANRPSPRYAPAAFDRGRCDERIRGIQQARGDRVGGLVQLQRAFVVAPDAGHRAECVEGPRLLDPTRPDAACQRQRERLEPGDRSGVRLAVSDDVEQPVDACGRCRGEIVLQRQLEGSRGRLFGLVQAVEIGQDPGAREQKLDLEWRMVQRLHLGFDRLEQVGRLGEATRGAHEACSADHVAQRAFLLGGPWILGHRPVALERGQIAARLDSRQLAGQLDGPRHDGLVGSLQELNQRTERGSRLVEAGHAQVQCPARLLMADCGGFAGVGVHLRPRLDVAIDLRFETGPRLGGMRQLGAQDCIADGGAVIVVPRLVEPIAGSAACLVLGGPGHSQRQAAGCQRDTAGAEPPPHPCGVATQCVEQCLHVGPALVRVDREATNDDRVNPSWHTVPRRCRGRSFELLRHDVRPDEGATTVERLPQCDAERVLIGTRIDGFAHVLLRSHVSGRAHDDALPGEIFCEAVRRRGGLDPLRWLGVDRAGPLGRACEPEIRDASAPVAVGDQDVRRLEVSVDEIGTVRSEQAETGVAKQRDDLGPGPWVRDHPFLKRPSPDVLHGDEQLVPVPVDVVHGDDVGVAELRHRLGFAEDPSMQFGVGPSAGDHPLDRHLTTEARIVGPVDLTHAPGPHDLEDHVATELRSRVQVVSRRFRVRQVDGERGNVIGDAVGARTHPTECISGAQAGAQAKWLDRARASSESESSRLRRPNHAPVVSRPAEREDSPTFGDTGAPSRGSRARRGCMDRHGSPKDRRRGLVVRRPCSRRPAASTGG
jgi:hypothetical protein